MRVFVTGHSGFIGSSIVPGLKTAGFTVHTSEKDIFSLTADDVAGIDAIIHLAAKTNIPYCNEHPIEAARINILGTIHVLSLAEKVGITHFVFASTASVYGLNSPPWDELTPPSPIESYGWQKASCETLITMWGKRTRIQTTILRLFQVMGESYRDDSFLAAFMKALAVKKPLCVTGIQSPSDESIVYSTRDFVHISDVVNACVRILTRTNTNAHEIFNISSGREISIHSIASMFSQHIEWIPLREYEALHHRGDNTKAKKILSWEPHTDMETWFEEFAKKYKTGSSVPTDHTTA